MALTIKHAIGENGLLQNDQEEIMRIFFGFPSEKYKKIQIDVMSLRKMVSCGMPKIPECANTELENTNTMEELLEAVKKGKEHKSPDQDGICHEFLRRMWDVIKQDMLDVINHMYMEGMVSDVQKHGKIVCLPNKFDPVSPEDYRPLTLLNADYKLLTRNIQHRLRPWMEDILHQIQYLDGEDTQSLEQLRQ